ncbi:hypothetical protein BGZ61DRAFT_575664 [Ilyonectria robusta]|uniref:uncharacterized protein n=1 Tax=Ilyonectria robusta TaxID=1079257 RepID=UPI001E8D312C|nr:uncharacterized protein BGZ61DRAFT_575664 [Ilyonectria robusta]KAH8706168.1 hypothetical protein BGZ61DRAFT_575664 [Ilyonectria robusta]
MPKPKLQSLRSQLMGAMIENYEGKKFLADSTLARITSETDLEGCLCEAEVGPATVRKEVHDTVLNGGNKTFAILAMMESQPVELLLNFLKVDQLNLGNLDSRLPYKYMDHLKEILGSHPLAFEFFNCQWFVMSPLFREDRSDRNFNEHTAKLACKEMAVAPVSDTFTNEKQILLLLRQIRHANMIQLLASYSIKTQESGLTRCLMFPLADTSLQTLLDQDVNNIVPVYFQSNEEFLHQLYGLASALESLHNYVDAAEGVRMKGSHFDLAPRNILVKKGKLLLADFGLSRIRRESSDSKTPFKGGAGDFLAPSVPLRASHRTMSTGARVTCGRLATWLTKRKNDLPSTERAALNLALWMLSPKPEQRPAMDEVSTYLYLVTHHALLRVIDDQFVRLLEKRRAMQLEIEHHRFTIWNIMAGLTAELDNPAKELRPEDSKVSWLVEGRTQFQAVSDIFQNIREENEFLLAGLNQDSPIAPVYNRLRELNGMLWNMAPLKERTEMLTTLEGALDQVYDTHNIQDREVSSATNIPSWERQALLLARMRFMKKKSEAATRSRDESLAISSSLVKHKRKEGQVDIFSIEKQPSRYLCEWVAYQLHTVDQVPERLFSRVESIARQFAVQPKPDDFNVLHCRHYFHDLPGFRFGLLFELPGNEPPVTLRRIMKQTMRPSLQCPFSLAQAIVKSVHYFHRAGWAHKNVSSHNVVFFDKQLSEPAKRDEPADELPTPYLVGFNHSRPMGPATFTIGAADIDKLYLHPDYRAVPEPRFHLGYDHFSVGLLLLEIGLWEPITRSRLLGKRSIEDFESRELHELWREHGVPLLGPLMGKTFRDAVALCLGDELVQMTDSGASQEFGKRVVAELGRCCV